MERMNRRNGDYGCASDPWASFSEPKTQSYKQEDVRFWEVSGHNITPNTDHIIDALLIRRNPGQEPSLSQDVIKGFLEQASLAELNDTNKTHPDERPVALLDDRKHDDQGPATGHARTSKGALTARQLYRELEKGRFKELQVPETDRHEPDAERRLLYITDVDSRAALAIVATASRSHIHYLRDFILRHLSHGAFFGAHINLAHGLKTYALEFHLPFYAVKRSSKPIKDTRRRGNGMPLRESWTHDFQLLQEARHQAGRDGKYCFYESQVSVEVTGCDERSWVGLAFVDTYFREEGNAERVDQFARQAATTIGNGQPKKSCAVADNHERSKVTLDPIALGRLSHKAPIWEPRRYFLRVLGYRFEQVLEEWEDVVQCIWDETSFYSEILATRNPYFSANAIPDDPDRTNISRRINDSLRKTVNLINKVTNRMSETIEIWGAFKAQNTKHFVDPAIASEPEEPSPAMLFDSVDIKFTELEILRQKMMSRKGWLKDLEQQLLADLQHDNIIVAINSQHTNEWAVLLGTITAAILTPLAIVIALFSIKDEVLPFPKTPLSFAITLICVAAIIFALAIATWKFSWHRRLLRKLKTGNSVGSEDLEMRIPLITASSNACDDRDQAQEQAGNS